MRRLLSIIILSALVGFAHAEIYTWTDENGRPVFSQTPKRGAEPVTLDPPDLISGNAAPTESKSTEQQLEMIEQFNDAREQAREEQAKKAALASERKQKCENAKRSMQLLQRGGNRRYQTPDGTWHNYTPEQRAEQRQNIQQFIDENCRQ